MRADDGGTWFAAALPVEIRRRPTVQMETSVSYPSSGHVVTCNILQSGLWHVKVEVTTIERFPRLLCVHELPIGCGSEESAFFYGLHWARLRYPPPCPELDLPRV